MAGCLGRELGVVFCAIVYVLIMYKCLDSGVMRAERRNCNCGFRAREVVTFDICLFRSCFGLCGLYRRAVRLGTFLGVCA
jgi:hypothetical protein